MFKRPFRTMQGVRSIELLSPAGGSRHFLVGKWHVVEPKGQLEIQFLLTFTQEGIPGSPGTLMVVVLWLSRENPFPSAPQTVLNKENHKCVWFLSVIVKTSKMTGCLDGNDCGQR